MRLLPFSTRRIVITCLVALSAASLCLYLSFFQSSDAIPSRVAILCLERSGSTWLTAMMNRNAKVNILAEPLLPFANSKNTTSAAAAAQMNHLLQVLDAAEAQLQSQTDDDPYVVGFNEKLYAPKYQLANDAAQLASLGTALRSKQYKNIILLRKNRLQQAISYIRASRLASLCGDAGWSRVNQPGWEAICGKYSMTVANEPLSLEGFVRVYEQLTNKTFELLEVASQLGGPYLTIYYEDLVMHTSEVMRDISRWIGHDLRPASTIFTKQHGNKLYISNYKEFLKFIGTYDSCLYEHFREFNPSNPCLKARNSVGNNR